jgi:hypothetical protein
MEPSQPKHAAPPIEFPDEAGYPDGTGTLDEGTNEGPREGTGDVVEELREFDEADNRDS